MTFTQACGEYTKRGFNDKGAIYAISLEQTRGAKKVFLVLAGG